MDIVKQKMFEAAKQGDLTFFQSQNFDENIVDEDGANCLHYVCRGGNVQLAQYFVDEKQFDVSEKTKFGSTAFHEAAASGSLDIVKWLWSKTEINIDEQDGIGATPLHIGALYGQLLVVHWIINKTSCDLMLKTDKGALCLHFAVVGGSLKVTTIILAEIPRYVSFLLGFFVFFFQFDHRHVIQRVELGPLIFYWSNNLSEFFPYKSHIMKIQYFQYFI